ncbi:pyridoxamine 5'-phosphate oxidase family protein [Microbacterium sp. SLBN-146]|uniref:pyridoxamine 5'-phosphate oxidase family protein n=1 Tax=Microbacterium sp. SLBN-146 TaxID=2768457 RepID=UPI001152AE9B|nr:pyridoxamine 5'-phosphate oxidase family protein [Microbacterium sp. SLBN-146]TQJ30745.1 pyridoxamine 5'-phosphate oxidase [Microbacterium sp. SLBN-146]
MAASIPTFSASDIALLSRPLYAIFTAMSSGDRVPAPRPVWFALGEDATIEMFSVAGTTRLRRLAVDPRASLLVTAPVGEMEQWVAAEGVVTLHDDGAQELATRLSKRYWHPDVIEDWSDTELVRMIFTPDRIRRFGP